MKRAPLCTIQRMTSGCMRLLLPAHRRWKAVLRTEITLDGIDLFTSEPQILHIPERLTVRGVTDVHHKHVVAASNHALQVKPFD
jgi:hypothetical protein